MANITGQIHRFVLTPAAARRLYTLDQAGKESRNLLARMIRGEDPGWVCAHCGLSAEEVYQLAAELGADKVMSGLIVQCPVRPLTREAHLMPEFPGKLCLSSLTRRDESLGNQVCESTLKLVDEFKTVPLLTPNGNTAGMPLKG